MLVIWWYTSSIDLYIPGFLFSPCWFGLPSPKAWLSFIAVKGINTPFCEGCVIWIPIVWLALANNNNIYILMLIDKSY